MDDTSRIWKTNGGFRILHWVSSTTPGALLQRLPAPSCHSRQGEEADPRSSWKTHAQEGDTAIGTDWTHPAQGSVIIRHPLSSNIRVPQNSLGHRSPALSATLQGIAVGKRGPQAGPSLLPAHRGHSGPSLFADAPPLAHPPIQNAHLKRCQGSRDTSGRGAEAASLLLLQQLGVLMKAALLLKQQAACERLSSC